MAVTSNQRLEFQPFILFLTCESWHFPTATNFKDLFIKRCKGTGFQCLHLRIFPDQPKHNSPLCTFLEQKCLQCEYHHCPTRGGGASQWLWPDRKWSVVGNMEEARGTMSYVRWTDLASYGSKERISSTKLSVHDDHQTHNYSFIKSTHSSTQLTHSAYLWLSGTIPAATHSSLSGHCLWFRQLLAQLLYLLHCESIWRNFSEPWIGVSCLYINMTKNRVCPMLSTEWVPNKHKP